MATVKITQRLKDEIIQNVSELFDTRLNKLCEQISISGIGQTLYEDAVGYDFLKKLEDLPHSWFAVSDEMGIKVKCVSTKDPNKNILLPITIPSLKQPLPFSQVNKGLFYRYAGSETPIVDPYIDNRFAFLAPTTTKYMDIREDRDRLKHTIKSTLNECVTLNQLVPTFPTILNFCGTDIRDRLAHKPVVDRKQREKRAQAVLTDEARAVLVKARLLDQ